MGYHVPWELIIGGALVSKQFDYCAAAFLREHTEDYMIILGSDMTFKPTDIEKLVQAAEERPLSVVDSTSVRANLRVCCNTYGGELKITGEPVEVISTGLGVSAVSRKLLLHMIDVLHLPEITTYESTRSYNVWPFFQPVSYTHLTLPTTPYV